MSQHFASDGQSTGTSASVLPMNIQGWIPLGLAGLTSLMSKGPSRVFSSTTIWKPSILQCFALFMVQLSHPYMTTGKTIDLAIQTLVGKVMSLLFNKLSRFVMAFLPRSKSFNFVAAVTIHSDFGVQENKICHCFHFSPSICIFISYIAYIYIIKICTYFIHNLYNYIKATGLPWWLKRKRICPQSERLGLDSWVRKIPWSREWLSSPVLLPGEFHGQRLQSKGLQRVGHNWVTNSN